MSLQILIISIFTSQMDAHMHNGLLENNPAHQYTDSNVFVEDLSPLDAGNGGDKNMPLVVYNEDLLPMFHKPLRTFQYLNHTIKIEQKYSQHGVAAVVWDSAAVLCEYLSSHTDIVRDRRVLELGAGSGMVGMVASLAGSQDVTVTDRKEVLGYLNKSISSNLDLATHLVHVKELDWTCQQLDMTSCYDVILGADIVYIEDTFSDLLRTLLQLSNIDTVVMLSCKMRYTRDRTFFNMLEENFTISAVYFDPHRGIHIYSAKRLK